MHVDTQNIEVIYEKASIIPKLYATDKNLVFYAKYTNYDDAQLTDFGWMLLDLKQGSIECLSNPYCSPENIVDHPAIYDCEGYDWREIRKHEREIVAVHMDRNIFWTRRKVTEGNTVVYYLEPRGVLRFICGKDNRQYRHEIQYLYLRVKVSYWIRRANYYKHERKRISVQDA